MKKTLKSLDLNLISQLVLGIIVLLIGVVVMIFKTFGLIDIVLYTSILFYIYAVFSTILYFVRRKEGDYELLLLSLINIIAATFMFVFKKDNPPMILGAGMSIYTILVVANRGCKILLLKNQNNFIWIIKFIVTFLIAFLGLLTTFNLFNEVTVQTMMFGFYFMSLGFMLTIENIIEIFITDETFKKILSKVLDETDLNENLEEIKEKEIVKTAVKESAKPITTVKKEKVTVKKVTKAKEEPKKKAGRPKKVDASPVKAVSNTKPTKKVATVPLKSETKTKDSKTVKKESVKSEVKTKAVKTVKTENKASVPAKKVGRPKKVTTVEEPKKKAGRPKKTK